MKGIYPIVPTPFFENGEIDFESIDRLVGFFERKAVHGLAVLGALGEGHKLSEREREQIIARYRKVMRKEADLVVGVRAAATDPAVGLAVKAQELGADALLLGPPPVQSDNAIAGYYTRVAGAVNLPIIIHDYPAATGISMSVELIARIFEAGPNIEYIKLEDPPTVSKIQKLWHLTGRELKVFGALGGMYAFEELEAGAVGIMTGFVYAELLVRLYDHCRRGEWDAAAALFYDFVPLNRWEFQPGIGVSLRKKILERIGVFHTAKVRHPGADADDKTVDQLFRIVRHLNAKGYDLQIKPE